MSYLFIKRYRKNLGDYGESLALKFLNSRGYIIIDQNFFSNYGEIDIIACHPSEIDTICFIEVKTRISSNFGVPEAAITRDKIARLYKTACSYFYQNLIEDKIFRLDVIAIFINKATKKAKIKFIQGISSMGEEKAD